MVDDFSYKHLIKIYGSEKSLYDVYKRCMSKIDVIEDDKTCMSWIPVWNSCISTSPKPIYEFALCFSCGFIDKSDHFGVCAKLCFIIVIHIFIYDKMNTDIIDDIDIQSKLIRDLSILKIPKCLIEEYS